MGEILTCVYCGMQYPKGTAPHGEQILTDHIKICEKHPLREAERKIKILRKALCDLIGSSDEKELKQMELTMRTFPGIEQDKINAINAIHVILETKD